MGHSLARMVRKGFSEKWPFDWARMMRKHQQHKNLRERCSRERDEQVQILADYFSIHIFPLNIGQVLDLILYDLFGHYQFLLKNGQVLFKYLLWYHSTNHQYFKLLQSARWCFTHPCFITEGLWLNTVSMNLTLEATALQLSVKRLFLHPTCWQKWESKQVRWVAVRTQEAKRAECLIGRA